MSWIIELYRSAIFKKAVMAVTGMILFGFVLVHMAGNLKLFMGKYETGEHMGLYKIDVYGEGLREIGAPILQHGQALWIARIVLLLAVVLHVVSAYQLTVMNRRARPSGYVTDQRYLASTYASRTMRWGGVIILLFVVYHLLHLTFGSVHPDFVPGAVFHNMVTGFSDPLVSGFYILGQIALGFHLYHGLWSMFQSLGIAGARFNTVRRAFTVTFAVLVTVGNISFPVAVLSGLVHV